MIKHSGTALLSNLVVGVLSGLAMSGVVVLLGNTLFTFDDPRVLYVLAIISPIAWGIVWLGRGIYASVIANSESKRFLTYVGDSYQEINLGVLQSIDGRRQIRIMSADFPNHQHFEELDPIEHIILENNVAGEPQNADGKAVSITLAAKVHEVLEKLMVRHFIGLPLEFTRESDERIRLPQAQILLIEERIDGIYLFRFTKEGAYAGDTWHESITEAQRQAEFEFQVQSTDWQYIPEDATDALTIALTL